MTTAISHATGEVTYLEAISQALDEEMMRDERVFLMGEDIGQLWRGLQDHRRLSRQIRRMENSRYARWPNPDLSAQRSAQR